MLAWLLTAQVLTAGGPALHVDVSRDRTLSCKANALLEKAVRLRLPRVRTASGAKPRGDDLIASLQRVGGADWRFLLTRADGTTAVSRELQAMPCPQLADLSALILERYLSVIDWAGKEGPVAPPPPPPPPQKKPPPVAEPTPPIPQPEVEVPLSPNPEPSPEPIADPPLPAAPSTSLGQRAVPLGIDSSLDPPPITHLTLSVGGGGWVSVPLEATGSLAISLGVRLVQRFHASLLFFSGAASLRGVSVNNLPRGSLGLQTHGGFATFSVCTGRFVLCGGLLAGARITTATSMGPPTGPRVFRPTTTPTALPEVGGYGRLMLPIYGRLGIAADLAIAAPVGSTQFQIDGIPASQVSTPAVDFLGSVALSLKMF